MLALARAHKLAAVPTDVRTGDGETKEWVGGGGRVVFREMTGCRHKPSLILLDFSLPVSYPTPLKELIRRV